MSKSLRIAVVGAGIGGLTSAARLSHAGHKVTLFEKTPVRADAAASSGRAAISGTSVRRCF